MWFGGYLNQLNIYNSIISYNNAQLLGGGISMTGSISNFTVINTTFLGNEGFSTGGAIAMSQSTTISYILFQNSVLTGNSALYGGAMTLSAKIGGMNVINTNHVNNTASSGGSGGSYWIYKSKVHSNSP